MNMPTQPVPPIGTVDSHTVTQDHIRTAVANTDTDDNGDMSADALWQSICDLFSGDISAPSYGGVTDPAYAAGEASQEPQQFV